MDILKTEIDKLDELSLMTLGTQGTEMGKKDFVSTSIYSWRHQRLQMLESAKENKVQEEQQPRPPQNQGLHPKHRLSITEFLQHHVYIPDIYFISLWDISLYLDTRP